MATNQSDPVARIYAAALYETARDRGVIGDVQRGLEVIDGAWGDKMFRDFFTSPRVPKAAKLKATEEALSGRVCVEVLNFMKLLVLKGREPQFNNIISAFTVYRDHAENRVHAWVAAGSPFADAEIEALKRELSKSTGGKEVVLHYQLKPDFLGGAQVRIGDRLIDNTLKTKLSRLAITLGR